MLSKIQKGFAGSINALPYAPWLTCPMKRRYGHGVFHPANVLFTAGGPIVIDWGRATRGDPTVCGPDR
jgi:aminoglycoside phosphotransferase (APT) family kinase protein